MYRTVVTICTAQWSLYVPLVVSTPSGHYMYCTVVTGMYRTVVTMYRTVVTSMYRTMVTICTAQWSLYVLHSGHFMYCTVVTVPHSGHYVPHSGHWYLPHCGHWYVPHSGHYMYRTVVTICTAQWPLYVLHSGHCTAQWSLCTAQWPLYVLHSGHYVPHSGHSMYCTVVTVPHSGH